MEPVKKLYSLKEIQDLSDQSYERGKASVDEYTPLKKFYAWYGIGSLVLHSIAVVALIVWAHHFINVNF